MSAAERLRMLFDGDWIEHDPDLVTTDPLDFVDTKPYKTRVEASRAASGLKDAVIIASGTIEGFPVVAGSMEFGFIGGSMGVVVGEKIARGIERAHGRARGRSSWSAPRPARACRKARFR